MEIFNRVFRIKHGDDACGTCFTIKHEDKDYLITAGHVVTGYSKERGLELILDGSGWKDAETFHLERLHVCRKHDIAIFEAPDSLLSQKETTVFVEDLNILGHSISWIGYPFTYDGGLFKTDSGIRPQGIISSGTLAALVAPKELKDDGWEGFLVEGQINDGHSGSPVFFNTEENGERRTNVFGVLTISMKEKKPTIFGLAGSLSEALVDFHQETERKSFKERVFRSFVKDSISYEDRIFMVRYLIEDLLCNRHSSEFSEDFNFETIDSLLKGTKHFKTWTDVRKRISESGMEGWLALFEFVEKISVD